ncbi:MAG TPA: methionine adenosyltransferase [Candidatus Deferrimicrobiaceae bacterium]|nr:methionine adenosyltransferase [Candidatus Deferrimicrobiaceae bacterium]
MRDFLFTSESVTGGHPDKVADQLSDTILDEILRKDRQGRVACETMVTTGLVMVAGEITTSALIDIPALVRRTIASIGYTGNAKGFDANNCAVVMVVDRQSPDIARGVDRGTIERQGAGDQGMMFGFACSETKELMPMPIAFAHRICGRLTEAREKMVLPWLRPDGKSQVTVRYVDGIPREVTTVVCSAQHAADVKRGVLAEGIIEEVIRKSIPADLLSPKVKFYINPTGRFVVGGPHGDTGLTGRKIIVDTYGGYSRHGGGAFSGKDPSKVDRSAAYMARYVAKNIVAAGLAEKCELQLAYAIGVAEPVSLMVETFGTGRVPPEKIERAVQDTFDLRPAKIIKKLDLLRPIYRKTAALGHFGREIPEFTWEKTDKGKALRKAAGL